MAVFAYVQAIGELPDMLNRFWLLSPFNGNFFRVPVDPKGPFFDQFVENVSNRFGRRAIMVYSIII
jgi:hypothetical protein